MTMSIAKSLMHIVPGHDTPFLPSTTIVLSSSIHHRVIDENLLSPERAALGESGLATGGLAKDLRATGADDDGLCVREDGSDGEATWALDVHEE